jgi:acetoin utilization protein AcuB
MKKPIAEIYIEEFSSPITSFATIDMTISEMIHEMDQNGFRHLPVVSNKKPVGVISAREIKLLKTIDTHFDLTAKDIMVSDPYTVRLGSSIEEVAFNMSKEKIGSALIVNSDGEIDSIFTSIDALNALVEIVRGDVELT